MNKMFGSNGGHADTKSLVFTSTAVTAGQAVDFSNITDEDEKILFALGYKQEFKRNFSIWRSFSVAASVLGLLPSIASTLGFNVGYAGLAGSVWGWLAGAFLVQFVALSLAELCSSMPTAGGLYYASAALAPPGWGPLCSWVTGWSNFLGYSVGTLSINYALAYIILAAGTVSNSGFVVQNYQIYLLTLALLIVDGILISTTTNFIGNLNLAGMAVNMIVALIFIIWIPGGTINPFNSNSEVWTGITNGTDWPDGFAFLLGFTSVLYTLAGYDTPFHLSEECSNANIAGPRAIVMTAQLGFWMGWAIVLVIAYTVVDVGNVLEGPYGQPMVSLCLQVLGQKSGLAMLSLNIVAQFFVGQGILVTASRLTFAYSRDGAIPGSKWWRQVNERTKTPINVVWMIVVLDALVGLLIFAGPVAINSVFTIAAFANYIAFCSPILLKLLFGKGRFQPGPWNLGRFSVPINLVACVFGLALVPILTFPFVKGSDLTAQTMNWTCLLYGGAMLFAMLWYAVDARKWFKGPKVNAVHVLDQNVIKNKALSAAE